MEKIILSLIAGLIPAVGFAGMYGGAKTMEAAQEDMRRYVELRTTGYEKPETLCRSTGLYSFKSDEGIYPIDQCLQFAQSIITEAQKEDEAKEQAKLMIKQKEEAELAAKKAEEQRQQQALEIDLKSGKKQPETLEEALITFDASRGDSLSSAPKIKPDGAFYGMPGKIAIAHDDDTFVGELVSDNAQQAVMSMLGINNGYAQYPKYYQIKIPQELKEYYYQNAKINGIFVFVGKYSANQQYTMVDGETGSMPVFEAVFFKMIY
ncbi:hypothetical protein [Methylobacter sp. BlB1]|uniref:hypothetical protein n=1 Tax=Methylobacter sp. BlB1 TaxID=2785914 RepID=UPI00189307C9|nr:hypothetical protein [Methylobacter sp. BlB1]MBF6649515.1 hypothetical protein [Methylobacter sp. BlB1]